MTAPVVHLERLQEELEQVVSERRALREACAPEEQLEANRQRLLAAQSALTEALTQHHFG